MAILKLSGIVSKISGKIGGSVLGTSTNGSYIKQNAFNKLIGTEKQSRQRTQIYQSAQFWRTATPTNKADWTAAAVDYPYTNKVGDTAYYTGYQLFNKLNQNNLITLSTILLAPPVLETIINPAFSFQNLNSTTFTVLLEADVSGNSTVIYCSPQMPSNQTPLKKEYRLIRTALFVTGFSIIDILSEYTATFGAPQVGKTIYFKIRSIVRDNGNSTALSLPISQTVV